MSGGKSSTEEGILISYCSFCFGGRERSVLIALIIHRNSRVRVNLVVNTIQLLIWNLTVRFVIQSNPYSVYLYSVMDGRIKKVLDYIEGHLDTELRLSDLSALACMSTSQFHRVFKRETNRTPFQFVEDSKMAKAYEVIVDGQVKVQQLAINLGYNDYETFTRAFKKHFYCSPDDLKVISLKLKENVNAEEEHDFIITTIDGVEQLEALRSKIDAIMKENNLSTDQLRQAKIYTVKTKSDTSPSDHLLIKNKFEVEATDHQRLWESLIDRSFDNK